MALENIYNKISLNEDKRMEAIKMIFDNNSEKERKATKRRYVRQDYRNSCKSVAEDCG